PKAEAAASDSRKARIEAFIDVTPRAGRVKTRRPFRRPARGPSTGTDLRSGRTPSRSTHRRGREWPRPEAVLPRASAARIAHAVDRPPRRCPRRGTARPGHRKAAAPPLFRRDRPATDPRAGTHLRPSTG